MQQHSPIAAHSDKHESHILRWALAGTAIAAGAVILTPFALPLVGIGTSAETVDAMTAIHNAAGGTGLAGALNDAMGSIPLIGETLAQGGMKTALISGALGVGGVLLNHYSHKGDDGKRHIRWGKVIGTTAMITSALIALPSLLTGISAGIVFLSSFADPEVTKATVTLMANTLGAANDKTLAVSSVSAASLIVPHLLTCSAGALPIAFSFKRHKKDAPQTMQATPPETAVVSSHTAPPAREAKDTIIASVRLDKPTTAGEMVNGHLMFTHADTGARLTKEELKVVNEAQIHFFINNSSLTDYHHIHPLPSQTPGEFDFSFKAATSQPYKGWATITTLPDEKHHEVSIEMPPAIRRYIAPNVRMNSQVDTDGLSFDWKSDIPLQKGVTANVEVTIKDKNGNSVTDLQPVWGEWCHLEGFGTDFKTMMHTHAHGQGPVSKADRKAAPLHFKITPPIDGPMQFYVQVRRGDQDIYAPIGQYVKAPEKATERVQKRELMTPANFAPQLSMGIG